MRSARTSIRRAREWFRGRRAGLPGSRRVTLAVVVGVVLVGTAAGVAAAEVTAGSGPHHRIAGGARLSGQAVPSATGTPGAGEPGAPAKTARAPGKARRAPVKTPPHASGKTHRAQGQAPGGMTSCRSVAHIGDSTSVDLISPADLPNPADRLPARYAGVGVRHLRLDASGGRSIVETMPHQVNGYDVARAWRAQGYRGCWVIALGTNDTANIAAGSTVGMTARIDEVMSVAHGEPVLWVDPVTELSSGPWSDAGERAFDAALVKALHRYPNLRVLDWAAVAQAGWFLPDGIHYNPVGCAMRARIIARGLARAFPLSGVSKGGVIR